MTYLLCGLVGAVAGALVSAVLLLAYLEWVTGAGQPGFLESLRRVLRRRGK